ncbi:hypothetical protein OOJ96_09155 [Pseudomonas sp. 15FMM2]|uniref:Uncharacterized protein n=1 Tax=Pseudomonas imrae TaxID=2992837 RepID=A0ACC7PFX2_9PSED
MSKQPLRKGAQGTSTKTQNKKPRPQKEKPRIEEDPPALPPIIHTLPDVEDDDQEKVVSVAQQLNGLPVTIQLWPNAAEFAGEFDLIKCYIDNHLVSSEEFEGPIIADVDMEVKSARLRSHGPKNFTYNVKLNDSANNATSLPISIFVDTIDPNSNLQPGALVLPANLPVEGVTPTYLEANGGVTVTLPRPSDSRPEDTYKVSYGSTGTIHTGTVPTTGLITATFTKLEIEAAGAGDFLLTYQFFDRAGNDTAVSTARTLTVIASDPPVLLAAEIPDAMPLVVKEEARNGVKVTVPTITGFLPNDFLLIYWNGIIFGEMRLGVTPIFPLEFTAHYSTIAKAGSLYTARIHYEIVRGNRPYSSPDTSVNVDLVEPGGPIIGPGPVDPNLVLPLVRGDSGVDNSLIASDLEDGKEVHATFTIYSGHKANEFIDLYYGKNDGQRVGTYPVEGTEPATFVVDITIPKKAIEDYGNGLDIPCWYVVRNANNYKQSRPQPVRVDIFSLEGLADPVFTNLNDGKIQCPQMPWLNVPIKIFDPDKLQDDDKVTISAVRYLYSGATQPATPVPGSEVSSPEIGIGPSERLNGFTHNFVLPYFDGDPTRRRGWLEITWSIERAGPPPEHGTSGSVVAQWDIRSSAGSGTCAPTTRGRRRA